MGAQCARLSPKPQIQNISNRFETLQHESIRSIQPIYLEIQIENVRVTNMTQIVSSIKFQVQKCFKVLYSQNQISLHQKTIQWNHKHKATLDIPVDELEKKNMSVFLYDHKGRIIQELSFKLFQICIGPSHHDHLLKELKSRLCFDIKITQKLNVNIQMNNFSLSFFNDNFQKFEDYGYSFTLTPGQDQQLYESQTKFCNANNLFEQNSLNLNILAHSLKQSIIKVQIWKKSKNNYQEYHNSINKFSDVYIPYRRVLSQLVYIYTENNKEFEKRKFDFEETLILEGKKRGKVSFSITVKNSKLHVEQMQCLIFSQNGILTMSPLTINSCQQGKTQISDLHSKLDELKNLNNRQNKRFLPKIKKVLGEIYQLTKITAKISYKSEIQLYQLQLLLIQILNKVCRLMTQGQDVLNQNLWRIIETIIHRPQLTIRYFNILSNQTHKCDIAAFYYSFICNLLEKIMQSTTMGVTFHELKCIQKFIAYAYFRYPWLQKIVIKCLVNKNDPQINYQKLVQIGACPTSKSPSKSIVYDWQSSLFNYCQNNAIYKRALSNLENLMFQIPEWSTILFNREDDDLFYGLLIEIWNEAQVSLSYKGKVKWQYFPYYGQLLGAFLGEMSNNKIVDYSAQFKQCSLKLISNQKLLNSFMMLLFPKTCLFESYCVMKCLDFVQSYFQLVTAKKKRLPKDFNFNYFYTGIRCIFDSNHSHLLVKTIKLIYTYYNLFSIQFKMTINSYILGKGFFQLFLHWSSYVRRLFYLLLQFKIRPSFELSNNPQQKNNDQNKDYSLSIQMKQKFDHLFGRLEQLSNQIKQLKQVTSNKSKQYYQHMKQKLNWKKCRKKQKNNFAKFDNRQLQEFIELKRKSSLATIKDDVLGLYKRRKWSMNYQQDLITQIPQELKTYLKCSIKQFKLTSAEIKPDSQVQRIQKLFTNGRSNIDA